MSDLQQRFEQAVTDSTELPEKPGPATLLRIYALYKQAREGDASGERPGMTEFVARSKFDAWSACAGMSKDAAMQAYVDMIEGLKAA